MLSRILAIIGTLLFAVALFGGHIDGLTAQRIADLGGVALGVAILL